MFTRLSHFVIFVCFLLLFPFGNVEAFDGKRKGFFIGVGLEPGASVDRTVYGDEDSYLYGGPSITLNCKIGYAPSEELLIYFTTRSSFYGLYAYGFNESDSDNSSNIYNDGTFGLGFTLFPNPDNNFYLSGCFGLATDIYLNEPDIEDLTTGVGISGGIGYMISSNVAVDIMLDYRKFSSNDEFIDWTVDIVTLSLAFNYLFY